MNRAEHIAVDNLLLGYSIQDVHEYMDLAVKWLGAGHRSIRHNINTVDAAKILFGNEAGYIALLHLLIDNKIVDVEFLKKLIKS
jgi:hypothetical protein